jgi:hypothetical protein
VAIEKAFRELAVRLRRLRDAFEALQLTAREDTPREGSVVLVDSLADAVDDCMGWIEEGLALAEDAAKIVAARQDLVAARLPLAGCQERFHLAQQRFLSDLVSYERLRELTAFGRRRKGEWQAWVKSMRQGAEQCRQPFDEVSRELLSCWQEIADRAAAPPIAVLAAGVGRQFTAADAKDLERTEVA